MYFFLQSEVDSKYVSIKANGKFEDHVDGPHLLRLNSRGSEIIHKDRIKSGYMVKKGTISFKSCCFSECFAQLWCQRLYKG